MSPTGNIFAETLLDLDAQAISDPHCQAAFLWLCLLLIAAIRRAAVAIADRTLVVSNSREPDRLPVCHELHLLHNNAVVCSDLSPPIAF